MTASDDDVAIRNLVAHVARFADTGTVDQYLGAFSEDVLFEIRGRPPSDGLQELKERTVGQRNVGVVGPSSNTMHLLGASAIDIEGDEATAYTSWALCSTAGALAISLVGRYEDHLVRTANGWKIRHRKLEFG